MRNLRANAFLALLCPLALFGQAAPQPNSGNSVAIVAGQPISEEELMQSLGPQLMQLRNQEYDTKNKALESLIRYKVVEAEAKIRNITPEKLIELEVHSKVAEPTEGEIEAYFLGQNRAGSRLEDVKEQYRNSLKQLKLVKARQAYADTLRAKMQVAVLLRAPAIDVAYDAARVLGNPNAPVTIVEFGDFQCPYCQKTEATLREVLSKYDGRVKLAFRDFPLVEIHARAEKAAEAARCAGEQGKFWEYHDSLFADQSKLDEASLIARAQTLKLDEAAFKSCVGSGKFTRDIEADRQEGNKVGVAGTPAYFINGVFLSGAQPLQEFEKIIDNEPAIQGTGRSIRDPETTRPQ